MLEGGGRLGVWHDAEREFTVKVQSFGFDREAGWTPDLPSPETGADLVLVFGASSYATEIEPFQELAAAFPSARLVGCSTSGEIHDQLVEDETLSVAVVDFATTPISVVSTPITADTSSDAGARLGAELMGTPSLSAVLVLSDGLDVNGTELARGLNAEVPPAVPVTGGLAGDGDRFEATWVLVDGKPVSEHAVAVGFYGDAIRVGHGSKGGWDIFGVERVVTRSSGNVLYELDGRPALQLYREYLGELASELPASGLLFPLALRDPGEEKQLVRTILGIDEDAGSLTFAGDVPQGFHAQLMQANFDRLVDGAEDAARSTLGNAEAKLCIAISCVGRRLVLGERTEDELEATMHVLPDDVVQVGFYSYGEISPYAEGTCDLHNQTMTLTTFAEV